MDSKERILIYDIETEVFDNKINPKKDKLKFFGCYSYITNKYYYLQNVEDIKKIINSHDFLVGFNNLQYDNQVLYYNNLQDLIDKNEYDDCTFKYKINIDLMDIFKKRAGSMKIKKGMLGDLLMSYSLDYISKTIGIVDNESAKIKDFDYNVLKKNIFTESEKKYIINYLKRDLDVTKKMYDWVEDYFENFKHFLNDDDIKAKKYLSANTSVFAYKAICKKLNLNEEYSNKKEHKTYGGGYVSYPAGESFEGNIYCMDYNSLYPSIFHQCNLYSIADNDENFWNGDNFFDVKGKYKKDIQGNIEKLLIEFYEQRLEYKKNKDPREYSIKIIINTIYGLAGNESFKHLYNDTTASDCTLLARQWIKLAREIFKQNDYLIIYTDTDSVYILDKFNDKNRMLKVKEEIINKIKEHVPFPSKHFDMGIDDEITHMWFFKGQNSNEDKDSDNEMDSDDYINKPKGLMKKNYIYLTIDGKVVVKNLGVRKKSTSAITRSIFWDYLVPKIKEEKKVKYSKSWFNDKINKLLKNDLYMATKRYKVNNSNTYKLPGQLQAQISKAYGPGIHFLIPNFKIGVGKGKKYCTIDEFKKHNLTFNDIDLSGVWRELNYFISDYDTKNNKIMKTSKKLFDF